nr:MAG TPA: hypothetical protein [Caudoviricetes sp.]
MRGASRTEAVMKIRFIHTPCNSGYCMKLIRSRSV